MPVAEPLSFEEKRARLDYLLDQLTLEDWNPGVQFLTDAEREEADRLGAEITIEQAARDEAEFEAEGNPKAARHVAHWREEDERQLPESRPT